MKLFKYKEFINENKYLGLKTSDDYINVDKESFEMMKDIFSDFEDIEELLEFTITPFASKVGIRYDRTYQSHKIYGNVRPQDVKVSITPHFKGEPSSYQDRSQRGSYQQFREAKVTPTFLTSILSSIKGVENLTDYEFHGIWMDYVNVVKVWDKIDEEEIERFRTQTIHITDEEKISDYDPKFVRNVRIVFKKLD